MLSILIASTTFSDSEFSNWKKEFGKHYTTIQDELYAMKVYRQNDEFIKKFDHPSVKLKHNTFSDWRWEDFRNYFLSTKPSASNKLPHRFPPTMFMMHGGIDWEKRGAITPVRQQGRCGSCWAFSATEAIEASLFLSTGNLTSLAPEYLVDCDRVDSGCDGGTMEHAFDFVSKNGICKEEDDPYTGGSSECSCKPYTKIEGYERVEPSESQMTRAVLKTPLSVSIEADQPIFQFYSSGIIESSQCGENLDHGVLLVGFGYDETQPYWRVKNSWGKTWGESGYVRLSRKGNVCGILDDASYPVGARNV